ncbi:uncharacterized protein isoform X1 [Choristoneura fumiferana]|uniref:uncharacterized protein isoform X1 n=1 Tax=Choristoneura fumiferana TaxID=7141 RepID=UPI003D155DE9
MAPVKFGLFKTRSRDHQEQPSTENLLQNSASSEQVTPGSPIPSTSKGTIDELHSPDISILQLDSDDEDVASESQISFGRANSGNTIDDPLMSYHNLTNQSSKEYQHDDTLAIDNDDASTSCDANSIQFDETPITPSVLRPMDKSLAVLYMKKKKNGRKVKEFQQLRDRDMWRASDVQVMQNLLSGSSNHDEQIKWEAIATARGLCTLTDNCTCVDCTRAKYLTGVADGDGGLGAAPLFSAIGFGCSIQ